MFAFQTRIRSYSTFGSLLLVPSLLLACGSSESKPKGLDAGHSGAEIGGEGAKQLGTDPVGSAGDSRAGGDQGRGGMGPAGAASASGGSPGRAGAAGQLGVGLGSEGGGSGDAAGSRAVVGQAEEGQGGGSDAFSTGGSTHAGGRGSAGAGGVPATGGAPGIGGDTVETGGSVSTGGATNEAGLAGMANATAGAAGEAAVLECETPEACADLLASEVSITKVSLFQSVEVVLMSEGAEVASREAPVVQGKGALVRVHVAPSADFVTRSIKAVLQVASSAGVVRLSEEKVLERGSSDADLASTFNLNLPGSILSGDASYRVWLAETSNEAATGDTAAALFPTQGAAALGEASTAGGLEIVVIPIRYLADGSGRLPDTGADQLAAFRRKFLQYYPVLDEELSIVVGEPMDWSWTVYKDGTDWDSLLVNIADAKDTRGGTKEQYYYGLFAPADSRAAYCGEPEQDCVTGLGFIPLTPNDIFAGVAVGTSFSVEEAAQTMVHEIGHNHNRNHSPCGDVVNIDPDYPDPGGSIVTWGYDSFTDTLRDPAVFKDFMSYCDDLWVSSYTYKALFERMLAVNTMFPPSSQPSAWVSIDMLSTGEARVGRSYSSSGDGGSPRSVEWLDIEGNVVGQTQGRMTPFDQLPGGILLVRDVMAQAAFLRIDGDGPVPLD